MDKNLIVLISMVISGIIVTGYEKIKTKKKEKNLKMLYSRFQYLLTLVELGKIQKEVINLDEKEMDEDLYQKGISFSRQTKIVLDGKQYTEKNYWFMMDKHHCLWIIGKSKDSLIELHSKMFEYMFMGGFYE